MKKLICILCVSICCYSCKSSKHSNKSSKNDITITSRPAAPNIHNENNKGKASNFPDVNEAKSRDTHSKLAEDIIDYAKKFEGVRYRYGGTTKKGMDCSGLVTTAFNSEGISLPRSSSEIALSGDWIDIKEVQKGDLLFFATNKKSRNVNHVALVTYVKEGQVEFMHATTSAGVITSSLAERYWYFAFVQARRVL